MLRLIAVFLMLWAIYGAAGAAQYRSALHGLIALWIAVAAVSLWLRKQWSAVRLEIIAVVALAAGCATNRPVVAAHEACLLNPSEWSKIDTPGNRAELMALRPRNMLESTVHQHLHPSSATMEAWLRRSNGDLSVCVYDPQEMPCSGGIARLVEFQATASGFVARDAVETVCVVTT